ncbi:unnamed protein product, partial [Nesidiocoris tenuis]
MQNQNCPIQLMMVDTYFVVNIQVSTYARKVRFTIEVQKSMLPRCGREKPLRRQNNPKYEKIPEKPK